jgi:hypothetical protein
MAKAKAQRFISPRGIAVFPKLNEPDTKFKPEGEFTCKLAFDADDSAYLALVEKLTTIQEEAFEKFLSENPKKRKVAKMVPVGKDELDEEGEETGRKLLNFKMNHKIKSKRTGKSYTLRPDIFDAFKKKLDNPPNIGGGSTLKVSFEVFPAFVESSKEFHLSLRMVAVQIIELVQFGARDADSYGFDEEDDGFGGSDEHTSPKGDADADEDGDGEEDDGDSDY